MSLQGLVSFKDLCHSRDLLSLQGFVASGTCLFRDLSLQGLISLQGPVASGTSVTSGTLVAPGTYVASGTCVTSGTLVAPGTYVASGTCVLQGPVSSGTYYYTGVDLVKINLFIARASFTYESK
ncbi:hypothetical protein ACOSQ3_029902 [Xanthoceras sorbifolium]